MKEAYAALWRAFCAGRRDYYDHQTTTRPTRSLFWGAGGILDLMPCMKTGC